jgi:hypothetical protein
MIKWILGNLSRHGVVVFIQYLVTVDHFVVACLDVTFQGCRLYIWG